MQTHFSIHSRFPLLTGTLLVLAAALVALLAIPANPVGAEPEATLRFTQPDGSGDVAAEGDDFFTMRLGDPEDFSNLDDVSESVGWRSQNLANGQFSLTPNQGDASFFLIHPGFDIAGVGVDTRNGQVYGIDPRRYSRLVFKYTASAATGAVLYWMSPGDPYRRSLGNSDIYGLAAGTHIVDMDLNKRANGSGVGALWTAGTWGGLRLSPAFGTPGVNVSVDWVRLVPATGGPTIGANWSCSGCSGSIELLVDLDNNPNNGGLVSLAGGINPAAGSASVPVSKLAPGNYYLVARGGNIGTTVSAGTFNVREAPIVEITAPSTTSGVDYATSVLGRPWDMTDTASIAGIANITDWRVSGGIAQGRATNGDPSVFLLNNNGPAIDTGRFKYLNFSTYLPRPGNNPFDMARAFWYDQPAGANVTGDLINWYNYWTVYHLDLTRVKLAAGPEGWTGTQAVLRIDPHEEPMPAFFQLGPVRLTGDQSARQGSSVAVTWNVKRGGGTVALSYRPAAGGNWTQFASGVPINNRSYSWNTGNVGPGTYTVRVVASDGVNNSEWLSDAPLIITPGSGSASPFSDVNPADYFYQPVLYLTSHGVISGYADSSFRPFNVTTRAQTAKIIVLAEGWPLVNPATASFRDVPRSDAFYQPIETAVARGIISGYSDRTFRPNLNVTRAQLSKMIVVAEGWALVNPATASFIDVPRGSTFYSYIETAYRHGVISGYNNGAFLPGANALRGQMSKIVYTAITAAAVQSEEAEPVPQSEKPGPDSTPTNEETASPSPAATAETKESGSK